MMIICRLNLILPQLYLGVASGLWKNYRDFCSESKLKHRIVIFYFFFSWKTPSLDSTGNGMDPASTSRWVFWQSRGLPWATKASLLNPSLKSSGGQCRVGFEPWLVHGAAQVWPLHPTESWTSHENRGGRISLTYGTGSTLPWSCEEALYSITSVAHTNGVRPTLRGCFLPVLYSSLSLANVGGPSKQVVLSHLLSYHKQRRLVLFRSFKCMVCMDSACGCACMARSLCSIFIVCVLHVLRSQMSWIVLPLRSLCYNFVICSEKKAK